MTLRLAPLVLCLFLSACDTGAKNESSWIKPPTETINCSDYFSESIPNGILYNNVWNKNAAKTFQWTQCLEKDPATGLYGWSWIWPTNINKVIFAYPQIKRGTSPWDPQPDVKSEFPLDSATLRSLVIEHELLIQGDAEHNVATSLWLTNTDNIGDKANPSIIIAELMIWTYETPKHMNPAGRNTGTIEVNDQTWEVWVDKNWSDASGANDNKWVYITFRAQDKNTKAKYDVIKFTDYAIEKQILPEQFYIADIELGTEIMRGSGLVWVKQFDINIDLVLRRLTMDFVKPVAVEAQMLIRKPVADVFEAIANPDITTNFWFSKSSGRLEQGKQIRWDWEMFGVGDELNVLQLEENRLILFKWESDSTTVEWLFVPYGENATLVKVINSGFPTIGDDILNQALDAKGGYTIVLAGLKAWLEQGIKLNLIQDQFPWADPTI